MRHFGNPMGGIASLGGVSTDDPSRGRYAPHPLPSGSILSTQPAGRAPLERSKALQAFLDCLAVASAVVLVCITAASVPVALFLLVFASF